MVDRPSSRPVRGSHVVGSPMGLGNSGRHPLSLPGSGTGKRPTKSKGLEARKGEGGRTPGRKTRQKVNVLFGILP